jgi:hypothetical protein
MKMNSEYEFLGAENEINVEENICMEMKEMGVMDINPDELRGWMMMTSDNDVDNVRNKPGVEVENYKNGTWMINGWINNNNTSSSEYVERGKIMSRHRVKTSWGVHVRI